MTRRTWNHRVMKHRDGDEDFFMIHEVHYDDDRPVAYTQDGVAVGGGDFEELRETLRRMELALEKPVLTPEDFKGEVDETEADA